MGTKQRIKHGNCFAANWSKVTDGDDKWVLCHGIFYLGGVIPELHAWCEVDDTAYDFSNRGKIILTKDEYYKYRNINTDFIVRYSRMEAIHKALETNNYGPWEEGINLIRDHFYSKQKELQKA